jgi:superfamily I DNA/RNA helicase
MNAGTYDARWSAQQTHIFDWIQFPTGTITALVVRARAGTGKTTTILEALNYAREQRILLCAFNKSIANELNARLKNPRAEAKTLHALGFAAVKSFWPRVQVERESGTRADALTDYAISIWATAERQAGRRPQDVPFAVRRLVSKLHTHGREIAPLAEAREELMDVALNFECEPDEEFREWFPVEWVIDRALVAMERAAAVEPVEGIDFADMIYLPVRNRWTKPVFDLVLVDEAQDMTVAQLAIAQGSLKRGGRIVIVGDDRQAIYGFRGADSGSLDRLKNELNAAELGLNTTYRCGRAIVEEAQKLVPDFRAGEGNSDGVISDLPMSKLTKEVAEGDFILSRVNAPLVSTAMALLTEGRRARIQGRDIGAGLKTLIKKLAKGNAANSVPQFLSRLDAWENREVARMQAANKPAKVDEIRDKAQMLLTLASEAKSVNDIITKIDFLFTDDERGAQGVITLSSVHRAKGLEADRVFVLADTLRDYSQEELNIQYVAITRAKHELVYVYNDNQSRRQA